MNRSTRSFILIALSMSWGVIVAGCGGDDSADGAPPPPESTGTPSDTVAGEPESGGSIVTFVNAEPAMMHPHLALTDGTGRFISGFVIETLLTVDNETLEFEPHLAKAWEVSEDHLSYTFHLRDDVTFSDGKPMTARDLLFTFEAINNPENDTGPIRSYLNDVERCELLDDYSVRFHVEKPYYGHLLMLGGLEVLPAHVYGVGEYNTHPANRAPVGTGPYVFDRWDTGQRIVLKRNPDYWKAEEPAYPDTRTFKIVTDSNAALQLLLRHDLDVMDFEGEMWKQHASKPEFAAEFHRVIPDSPIPGYLSRYNYIGWNTRKPQFADKRVRQALCMLFDRQLIIDAVWGGLGTIITGPQYHKLPEYNSDVKPWPFDPKRAVELLEEAGWVDRDRDGIREKDGVPFVFELNYAANLPEYDRLGTVYQEELKRVGIELRLDPLEWATFQERLHNRKFDACMLAWLTGLATDPYQLWHSSQAEKGSNYPGLKLPEVDRLIEEARREFDRDKRIEKYHRFHEIIHDEQPYIFLYARPGMTAIDRRIQGVKVYPAGLDPLEWWIPKAKQIYK